MTRRRKRYMFLFIIAAVLSGELVLDDNETPRQRAYNECRARGLAETEIDEPIDTSWHSTLSRKDQIELFDSTFTNDEDGPEGCLTCVEAVLDAAGVP